MFSDTKIALSIKLPIAISAITPNNESFQSFLFQMVQSDFDINWITPLLKWFVISFLTLKWFREPCFSAAIRYQGMTWRDGFLSIRIPNISLRWNSFEELLWNSSSDTIKNSRNGGHTQCYRPSKSTGVAYFDTVFAHLCAYQYQQGAD